MDVRGGESDEVTASISIELNKADDPPTTVAPADTPKMDETNTVTVVLQVSVCTPVGDNHSQAVPVMCLSWGDPPSVVRGHGVVSAGPVCGRSSHVLPIG